MPEYVIVKPCSYTEDDEAFVHSEPGAIVELEESTARKLGDAVQKLNREPAAKPSRKRGSRSPSSEKPKTGQPGEGEQTVVTPTGDGDPNPGADGDANPGEVQPDQ